MTGNRTRPGQWQTGTARGQLLKFFSRAILAAGLVPGAIAVAAPAWVATPAAAQSSIDPAAVAGIKSGAAATRQRAEEAAQKAKDWRALAASAKKDAAAQRKKAAEWRAKAEKWKGRDESAVKQYERTAREADAHAEKDEKFARDRIAKAKALEAEATRLNAEAASKEAEAARLEKELAAEKKAKAAEEATSKQRQTEIEKKQEERKQTIAAIDAIKMPLEQLIHVWRHESDDWPFVIVPDAQWAGRSPNAYPNRLEAHTLARVWKGEYHPESKDDVTGEPQPIRAVFRYVPKAPEMNPDIPLWARKAVEGKLEWRIELKESGTCGSPHLLGRWYRGEVTWENRENGEAGRAWVSGDGEPYEFSLRPADDPGFDTFGAIRLGVKLPGPHDPFLKPIDGLTKRQLFYVEVILPPAEARKVGKTLTVTITAKKSRRSTTIKLTRGVFREGYSSTYSHDDAVTFAERDVTDPKGHDRKPPPYSLPDLLGDRGPRLDLDVANGEDVEFRYGTATQTIPVYNTRVQRGIARYAKAIPRLRVFFGGVLANPKTSRGNKLEAQRRLQMLKNLEAILAAPGIHDRIRLAVGELYLDERHGLTGMTKAQIEHDIEFGAGRYAGVDLHEPTPAEKAAAKKAKDKKEKEKAKRPWNPAGKDAPGLFNSIGNIRFADIYKDVVWTSPYEQWRTHTAILAARDDTRRLAFETLPKAWAFALYTVAAAPAANGVTIINRKDIFGKPVRGWQRIMAAVGLVTEWAQIGVSYGLSQSFYPPPNRISKFTTSSGDNYIFYTKRGSAPGFGSQVIKVARSLTSRQRAQLGLPVPDANGNTIGPALAALQSEAEPVACPMSRGRSPTAPLPGPIEPAPGPPRPLPNTSEHLGYGPNARALDTVPMFDPQRYGSCQVSSLRPAVKEALNLDLDEHSGFGLAYRNGIVGPRSSRPTHNPLQKGYFSDQKQQILELLGAETLPIGAKRNIQGIDQKIRDGWYVDETIRRYGETDAHTIRIMSMNKDAKGDIASVIVYDPGPSIRIEVPICDYVKLRARALDHPSLAYRWRKDSPQTAQPVIEPPRAMSCPAPMAGGAKSPKETKINQATDDVPSGSRPPKVEEFDPLKDETGGGLSTAPTRPIGDPTRRAESGWVPSRCMDITDVLLDAAAKEPDGLAPPVHATTIEGWEGINRTGNLNLTDGANFSYGGNAPVIRGGPVVIRVKPGHENHVQFTQGGNFGAGALYWPEGIGNGRPNASIIPTTELQWLYAGHDSNSARWVDFDH